MASGTLSPLHLIGSFNDPFTGAERELPDLAACIGARRKTMLWSDMPPHPSYLRKGVRAIRPFAGEVPRGGMLLFGGIHPALGVWLRHARPERVALRYNLAQHDRLYAMIAKLREETGVEPELLFVSKALQLGAGLPGTLERSLIRLDGYLGQPVARAQNRPFTVGRVSRDVLSKHHPDDPALWRMLAARGWRVRIMGGMCLAPQLAGVPGIELLPAGVEEVAAFLGTLDTMFYRTADGNEAYGRVVFEAMATGLPVVAASQGGYVECLEPGVNALLVSSQEQALDTLEALAREPELRERVGHAARQRAVDLHGDAAVERQLQFYLA